MAELEEIVERRNYKLKIDWACRNCNSKTDMVGCVLPGEKCYIDRKCQVTWDDILHKKCRKCGLVERPIITCQKCQTSYKFGELGCGNCDVEIEMMIDLQDSLHIIQEQIRKDRRKKNDVTDLESNINSLYERLNILGYSPCNICKVEFTLHNQNRCFECISD